MPLRGMGVPAAGPCSMPLSAVIVVWMTDAQCVSAPETLTVRELATGGKILVTTLRVPETNTQSGPESAVSRALARGA